MMVYIMLVNILDGLSNKNVWKVIKTYQTFFIIFAGTPATTVFAGTSFVTTAPAATIALSPILTPRRIVALEPIQTFFPIWIGAGMLSVLCSGYIPWLIVAKTTWEPIKTSSSIFSVNSLKL